MVRTSDFISFLLAAKDGGSSGRAGTNAQVTAALFARLPRGAAQDEPRAFEGSVVDDAGDPAHRLELRVGDARFLPRLLQRTGVELDVEPAGVAPAHVGLEQAAMVGNEVEERVAQAGEIARREALELSADGAAALVDRALENFLGLLRPDLGGKLIVESEVHHRARLDGVLELLAEVGGFVHLRRVPERGLC